MKKLAVLLFLLTNICITRAQYYSTGEDPSRVKFDYFETPHFRVVFPRAARDYALHLGSLLEQSYQNVQFNPQQVKTRKISVLVHTLNSVANGYVTWAPKRMELMALSPFDFGPISWSRDLSVHEFRHVSQISSLYKGLTGVSFYLLGEQGIGLTTSLVPQWFYEGDAVVAETAFTQAGRGREASFILDYRTRLSNNVKLSFDQYLNGSYKIPIPNHYVLGYTLNSYGRIAYGASVWDSIVRYTTRNPYMLAPFSFGIKKFTGKTRRELFASSLNFYDSVWNGKVYDTEHAKNRLGKHSFQSYAYPTAVGTTIYAFKSTLSRNPILVSLDTSGKERRLLEVQQPNSQPATDGQSIYWTEFATAGRWSQVVFSVVKRYDIARNKVTQISDRSYYSYPIIKGDSILVVKYHESNQLSIGIYTKYFKNISEHPIPFSQVKDLHFYNGKVLYTTLDSLDNMIVVEQDLSNGDVNEIFNFGRRLISRAVAKNGALTFISDFSGKAEMYRYNISAKTLIKILSSDYAINNYAFISDTTFAVNSYGLDGFRISRNKPELENVPVSDDKLNYPVAEKLSQQVGVNLQDSMANVADYKVKKYFKATHLFNFHSWAPFYFDPADVQNLDLKVYPGITLISQNLLSTSFATLAYGYTSNGHVFDVSYSYKGWLPVFNFRFNRYNTLPKVYTIKNHPYDLDSTKSRYNIGVSTYLPIHFKNGIWNFLIQPFADYSHYNDVMFNSTKNRYYVGLDQVSASIYLAAQTQLAHQNIFPRWGVNFYFKAVAAPFEHENLGNLFAYKLGIIVPGLLGNHGFMTRLCYQNQNLDRYYFSNSFSLPRGYNVSSFPSQYYKLAANDYTFPLAYPDANLSWLLYLKRIRMNLFGDFAQNRWPGYIKQNNTNVLVHNSKFYSSVGTDLLLDINLLRSTFPITTGLRFAYNNNRTTMLNGIFTISFY